MSRLPFQIKICGVTTPEDALAVVEAGADAIGLNFYPHSKRYISLRQAWDIAQVIPPRVTKVGVFVNPLEGDVEDAMRAASLNMVQFHGKEPPEFLTHFQMTHQIQAIKAFGWESDGRLMDEYLTTCVSLECKQDCVLLDTLIGDSFGGTGISLNWDTVSRWRQLRPKVNPASAVSVVLAGGLKPENVAKAIGIVRPDAIDTASGVEISPGRKDAERVRKFIAEAKRAFAALG